MISASWLINTITRDIPFEKFSLSILSINIPMKMYDENIATRERKGRELGRDGEIRELAGRNCVAANPCYRVTAGEERAINWLLRGTRWGRDSPCSIATRRLVPIERLPADWHFAPCRPEVIQCQWPASARPPLFLSCPVLRFRFQFNSISLSYQSGKEKKDRIIYLFTYPKLSFFSKTREDCDSSITWKKILKKKKKKKKKLFQDKISRYVGLL